MKTLRQIIYVLIATVAFTWAVADKLAWDQPTPPPIGQEITAYKVYEHVGVNYNLFATTGPSPSPTSTPNPPGTPIPLFSYPLPSPVPQSTPRFFVVTAVNNGGESARSVEVTWTPTPTPTPTPNPPANLRLIP